MVLRQGLAAPAPSLPAPSPWSLAPHHYYRILRGLSILCLDVDNFSTLICGFPGYRKAAVTILRWSHRVGALLPQA